MSSLIKEQTSFILTQEKLETIFKRIRASLVGRVEAIYVFGSASEGSFGQDSDIDLILVVKSASASFIKRAEEFTDLFEIWPKLDLLVYTQRELELQLADSDVGFWKSVRLSMREISE